MMPYNSESLSGLGVGLHDALGLCSRNGLYF